MATITTRSGKGSPLENSEVDANFTNLNNDKQEVLAEGSFADGDKTKLDGIESGATADQTASEIKTAYESNADTNAFTDAEQTKLSGIEAGADVTDTANVTAAGALMDSEVTNLAQVKAFNSSDYVAVTGDSMTGNLSFGDNDKAIFGAGSDLQIYHDGSNSYINENGTGNLTLLATNLEFVDSSNTDYLARFVTNGAASLYYDGTAKLATTSTGIDVTGTVTADGLTVSGATEFQDNPVIKNGSPELTFSTTNPAHANWQIAAQENLSNAFEIASGQQDADASDDTWSKRLTVLNNGDISFYEDTGTTAKFFWDASAERLGIRTTSPNAELDIVTDGNAGERLWVRNGVFSTGTGDGIVVQSVNNAATGGAALNFRGTTTTFSSATAEVMRIDSSGNVGIGTSSPSHPMHIYTADSVKDIIRINNPTLDLKIGVNSGSNGSYVFESTANALRFGTNNTERMRIDSSGNLLVGTTNTNPATTDNSPGTRIATDGQVQLSRDGSTVLRINRKTDDGDIIDFRKDGTTVGSIGTGSGYLTIGDTDTGVLFHDFGNRIQPWNMSTNNSNDNVVDLGGSGDRFKDLYLSGGVYLGGTGSANYLDDYETGTWTPTVGGTATYTERAGSYTKIGKMVFIRGYLDINVIGTGNTQVISGLPFTSDHEYTMSISKLSNSTFSFYSAQLRTSGSGMYLSGQNGLDGAIAVNQSYMQNNTEIQFSGCYLIA